MANIKDLTGKKFGRLVVLSINGRDNHGRSTWNCICECGTYKVVNGFNLKNGNTNSCGCYNMELVLKRSITHHSCGTSEYKSFTAMKTRCYNSKDKSYKNYGGRGIKVCDRWLHSFENFLEDMGKRPSKKHSIDRIDNNGDYEPSNCKWSTRKEQMVNRRNTVWVSVNGNSMCQSLLANLIGINVQSVANHIKKGENGDEILKHFKNKNK